jgi:CheY-like chemotaxis protein
LYFFKEALQDLAIQATLTTLNDGVELMQLLTTRLDNFPDILFLDLNMPRKTGFQCLAEIKADHKLTHLPIVIFSTSMDMEVVDLLYELGAHFYVRKPPEFSKLKQIIYNAKRPSKENFVLRAG